LYRLGPKAELGVFLEAHVRGDWTVPWTGKVESVGWMSVRAAITALATSERMSDLPRRCVHFAGDVDTVAAIALAAGSCCAEIEQDLPRASRERPGRDDIWPDLYRTSRRAPS
jgi:hypothetical protein